MIYKSFFLSVWRCKTCKLEFASLFIDEISQWDLLRRCYAWVKSDARRGFLRKDILKLWRFVGVSHRVLFLERAGSIQRLGPEIWRDSRIFGRPSFSAFKVDTWAPWKSLNPSIIIHDHSLTEISRQSPLWKRCPRWWFSPFIWTPFMISFDWFDCTRPMAQRVSPRALLSKAATLFRWQLCCSTYLTSSSCRMGMILRDPWLLAIRYPHCFLQLARDVVNRAPPNPLDDVAYIDSNDIVRLCQIGFYLRASDLDLPKFYVI